MTFIILLGIIGAFYAVYRAVSIFWKITEKDRISKTFLAVIVLHSAFIVGIVIFFLAFNFDCFHLRVHRRAFDMLPFDIGNSGGYISKPQGSSPPPRSCLFIRLQHLSDIRVRWTCSIECPKR
jgi:hypothetical protein